MRVRPLKAKNGRCLRHGATLPRAWLKLLILQAGLLSGGPHAQGHARLRFCGLNAAQACKGKAPAALTSPKEKLVCRSFTLGRLISTSRANWLKVFRSLLTTCSSNVPVPLM